MRQILFASVLLSCFSCVSLNIGTTTQYHEYVDSFDNRVKKEFNFRLKSEKPNSPIRRMDIFSNNDSLSKMYFTIYTSPSQFFPERMVHFKIDNEIVKLPMEQIESNLVRYDNQSTSTIMKADSTSESVITSVSHDLQQFIKFKISLNQVLKSKLANSVQVQIRIISGGRFSTFAIKNTSDIMRVF
ncbi:MAG: hypothetical protein ACRCVT_11960 [Leadbetterella sp.]